MHSGINAPAQGEMPPDPQPDDADEDDDYPRDDLHSRILPGARHTVAGSGAIREDGRATDRDLGVDWRAHPPVRLEAVPVLSIDDAVGNKVEALFSRAMTCDFLDVDAIRCSGRHSDEELLDVVREVDPGFDLGRFAQSLDTVERIQPEEVRISGLTAGQLDDVKMHTKAWASSIRASARRDNTQAGLREHNESEAERLRAKRDDDPHKGEPRRLRSR